MTRDEKLKLDLRDFWRIHDGFEPYAKNDVNAIMEHLKAHREDGFCDVVDYAGTGRQMCTRDAYDAIRDLAERHRDSMPVPDDYSVEELIEGIRKHIIRAIVEEKQDEPAVARVLSEAVSEADKNHIGRTYHFPCVIAPNGDPPQFRVGAVVFTSAKAFPEVFASEIQHYLQTGPNIKFDDDCIQIEQAFRLAEITTTKTKSSKADVPMCGLLADYLRFWKSQTPYHRDTDYVFASDKLKGAKPRCGQMVNRDYLKPAAVTAGIIKQEERFGFHSLRHSLSTWVNRNLKDVKIAQTLLRHSKPEITAGIYIHGVPEENLKAQEQYMDALAFQKPASDAVQ